jgi:hypothetical protein
MAKCAACQKTIMLGATKVGDVPYCGEKCADGTVMPLFSSAYDATEVQSPAVPKAAAARTGPEDSMLVDRSGHRHALVIAIGIVVALVLSCGLYFAEASIGRELRGLNLWIILPVGAALNGALISLGFFAAIRLLDAPPRMTTFVAAIATAGILCWLTFVISYYTMTDDQGTPIREFVGFAEFMKVVIEESQVSLGRSSKSPTTVGLWGYALYAADWLGFMIGAWFTVRLAGAKPYCASCGRFMAKIGRLVRSGNDPAEAGATLKAVHAHLAANNPARAVESLSAFGARAEKSYLGITLDCHGCPMCKDYSVVAGMSLAGARGRRAIEDATTTFTGNGDVRLS